MAEKTVPMNQETDLQKTQETTRSEARYVAPPVDIYEEDDQLVVVADLPGAHKDSISVSVENGILTLQAAVQNEAPGDLVYREFEFVNFFRQFEISEQIDIEHITADLNNGVLTLRLPKAEQAKPKKVEVKISE
ncbi:MAG TPA: Hsp20/alpha crystallin family protein [bacterium]|nr:Hsp20/alpha crystallin family protein [bacterium]HOL95512.1 Hsp20/alpha crystallin family protein [bacterium]HPO99433.1 Hsp20/alpha crystallin family protein [bacterium]HXK94091.1 Hsp20/alpha crystallin family protein [bacterium]